MNRQRLVELRDFLATHPDRFSYGSWIFRHGDPGHDATMESLIEDKDKPKGCGSVGCVAGWAVALFADSWQKSAIDTHEDCLCVDACAAELLDLDWRMQDRLFLNHIGPDFKPYGVEEAIRRIDELLNTGTITLQWTRG